MEKSSLEIAQGANQILKKRLENFRALSQSLLESQIMDAANRAGKVKSKAMGDLVARGRKVFRITEDGSAIEPRDEKGMLIFGSNPPHTISVDEWAGSLKRTAPHFWEAEKKEGKPVDLEAQLQQAIERKDTQAQIRLKRLIAEKQTA